MPRSELILVNGCVAKFSIDSTETKSGQENRLTFFFMDHEHEPCEKHLKSEPHNQEHGIYDSISILVKSESGRNNMIQGLEFLLSKLKTDSAP